MALYNPMHLVAPNCNLKAVTDGNLDCDCSSQDSNDLIKSVSVFSQNEIECYYCSYGDEKYIYIFTPGYIEVGSTVLGKDRDLADAVFDQAEPYL